VAVSFKPFILWDTMLNVCNIFGFSGHEADGSFMSVVMKMAKIKYNSLKNNLE